MDKTKSLETEKRVKKVDSIMKIETLKLLRTLEGDDFLRVNKSLINEILGEDVEKHDLDYILWKNKLEGKNVKLGEKDNMSVCIGWGYGPYIKRGNFTVQLSIHGDYGMLMTYQEAIQRIEKTFPKVWLNQEVNKQKFDIAIKKTSKKFYIEKISKNNGTKKRYHIKKEYHNNIESMTLEDCISIILDKEGSI